jgi:hypothetical protein
MGGGIPIEAGGYLLGAIAVSGAPGGEADDVCEGRNRSYPQRYRVLAGQFGASLASRVRFDPATSEALCDGALWR